MIETQRERRGHEFLPAELEALTPRLYETENTPLADKIVYIHFFCAGGDWWVTELDAKENRAFGYAKLAAFPEGAEWGYISLEELETLNVHNGLVIVERDCFWTPKKFSEIRGI